MASMYSAKVMEHFANPHNVGEIPDANGVGEVGNPKCGDIMRMYLKKSQPCRRHCTCTSNLCLTAS